MKTFHSVSEYREWRKSQSGSLGFVPTMGALHQGHLSLIERARAESDKVAVSIFVNATQFNDPTDCETYPQPLEEDLALCEKAGVDAVFLPKHDILYPDGYRYRITENELANLMEGKFRPGHFDGVLTVVMKLLQIIQPDSAYFGEKDWQQLRLIEGMVDAFFLPVKIVPCPTLREEDGLAMSSRNVRLDSDSRQKAPRFHHYLKSANSSKEAEENLSKDGFEVEYVEDYEGRRLGAVHLGGVRLIDNLNLSGGAR